MVINYEYRCVELNRILSDHSGDAFVRTVAAMVSRLHHSSVATPHLFHGHDAVGHVQFEVTAGGRVNNHHYGDAFRVEVRDQTGTLIRIICVQLN